jgi:spermidine synthase
MFELRRERILVLSAYLLSGACGLVYEVVWTRQLSLTFGITVFATSTVLAAFMAGLGLGSLLVGRWIDASRNPLRVYALLEIGIGVYALLVPYIFQGLTPVYVLLANRLEDHFLLFNFARGALAFTALLVPTLLMGGSVPAIGRFLVVQPGSVGWQVGLLYALNTLGAVIGCLGSAFVLLPALGISHTVLVTAAINLTIGVTFLALRLGEVRAPASSTPCGAPIAAPAAVRLAILVFALSGSTALAAEVVWTRVLVFYLHNSTYAFSLMLAVLLIGLTLGDLLLMWVYDRIERPLFWLGTVEVLLALSVIVAALTCGRLGNVGTWSHGSWGHAVAVMFVRAGLVLLPSALLYGMTFPLVARVVTVNMQRVGRDLGGAYAANSLGGVLGSFAGGFLLIPMVGLRGTVLVLSALNATLAAMCWIATTRGVRRTVLVGVAASLGLFGTWAVAPTIFLRGLEMPTLNLIQYSEGVTDTTGVWESTITGHRIVMYGDMRGTAGTETDVLNRTQAHLAHLLHPHPTRSLQICFGVGNTLAAAALHPEVEQLDCVELSPHVRQTAPYFWTNANVLDNPKVRLIIDDGRNYLLRTQERYQVITLEPPEIFTAGVVNLFTEEFYRLAANVLTEDGLLCQWLPIAEMNEYEMRMMVRAFTNVFPETTMWREGVNIGAPLLLVGTKRPLRIDAETLAARMRGEAVHDDLTRIGIGDPAKLFELFIAGKEGTQRWVGDVPPVTDDRTVVDFTTPRTVYSGFGFGYFRLAGADADAMWAHVAEIGELYQRLHEPITPLLVDEIGRTR